MDKGKHTPGPWKMSKTHFMSGDTWYVITDQRGYGPIMEVGGKDLDGQIAEAKHLITNPQEIEANATLIAAAPELLEVCKIAGKLLDEIAGNCLSFNNDEKEILDNIWSAISKAEGGQNE